MFNQISSIVKPDYEKLFKEAIIHLDNMVSSRNNFLPEVTGLLYSSNKLGKDFILRRSEIEQMHLAAHQFCKENIINH